MHVFKLLTLKKQILFPTNKNVCRTNNHLCMRTCAKAQIIQKTQFVKDYLLVVSRTTSLCSVSHKRKRALLLSFHLFCCSFNFSDAAGYKGRGTPTIECNELYYRCHNPGDMDPCTLSATFYMTLRMRVR